jgi:TM2 domain-containing membrane protein YozV
MNHTPEHVQEFSQESAAGARPQEPVGRGAAPEPARGDRAFAGRDYFLDDPRRKSPILASLLSAMPGLGQIYVGYYQQGFINVLVVGSIIALLHWGVVRALEPLLGIFLAFFWLYNVVDAGRRASFYNNTLAGLTRVDIPEDFSMPKGRGTLAGGAALVVFGLILFGHTMYRLSLDWLEQWWPMVIIGLGAYLIYQAVMARRAAQNPAADK